MAGAVAGLLVTGNYPALKERYYAKDAEPAALPVLQQSLEGINTLAGSYFGVKNHHQHTAGWSNDDCECIVIHQS
ncbi:hypothetical protein ACFSQ7_28235 [Paenibacillus rhizoplanae]